MRFAFVRNQFSSVWFKCSNVREMYEHCLKKNERSLLLHSVAWRGEAKRSEVRETLNVNLTITYENRDECVALRYVTFRFVSFRLVSFPFVNGGELHPFFDGDGKPHD